MCAQIQGLLHLAGIESPGLASSPAVGDYAVELLGSMGLDLRLKPDFKDERPKQVHFAEADDAQRAELIKKNPLYGRIICRCEMISEGEILSSIHRTLGATTLDGVKRRTRAGMGRCQGGFCGSKVVEILARELNVPMNEITKFGGKSKIMYHKTK